MSGDIRLDVGSGGQKIPGYTSVDEFVEADVKSSILDLVKEFSPGSVREIRSSHSFEHLKREDAPRALKVFHTILCRGGRLWIDVPDLAGVGLALYQAEQTGDTRLRDWCLKVCYGLQDHPGEFHQNGFTLSSLVSLVEAAGFTVISTASEMSHAAPAVQVLAEKR
jgi:predicted SAM-dependent methyltransferase